jgi:flagellar secretion chaperone FliS
MESGRRSQMTNTASDIYYQVEVNTSNGLKLVVMLYEGAIRFLTQARISIECNNLTAKATEVDRALAILGELQSTLRLEEGGEIALSLNRIYAYMMERIIEASSRLDVRPLDEVIKLLRILNSAWTEISRKAENHAARSESLDSATMTQPTTAPLRSGPSSLQVVG